MYSQEKDEKDESAEMWIILWGHEYHQGFLWPRSVVLNTETQHYHFGCLIFCVLFVFFSPLFLNILKFTYSKILSLFGVHVYEVWQMHAVM